MEFHLFLPQMRMPLGVITERAAVAEEVGFRGLALIDHLVPPQAANQPMYEAMMTAMWLAGRTERLVLGHLVLCDAFRHPALVAQQAVTIDHASNGRFELGLGWGSAPAEFEIFGIGGTEPGPRVRRLGETLDVVRALWSGEPVDYDGEFHHLRDASQRPTPLTTIPILVGGGGPKTMELVARHADIWNLPTHMLDRLDELKPRAAGALVSIQQLIALVPSEDVRADVTEKAQRRFGWMESGLVIGDPDELVAHFTKLRDRGVKRVYAWFADFAVPDTLRLFAGEVIGALG
jgi:alkanesulfonate monooxygenase SsuD/methylene tetrahydromethanopterin reductase-like flavin-dependent oxidoreductase (luciferase family)